VVQLIPLVAIPVVIVAHWRRVWIGYRASDAVAEWFRWPDYFRMSDVERALTFGGTLALFVYLAIVLGDGETPNALAAAAAVVFLGYLALDFYVGVRHPAKRPRR
jgi:hypothetical protein